MDKKDKRTYCEEYRFTGFFNARTSLIIKSYAYVNNLSNSKAMSNMCREFISRIPEKDVEKMIYLFKRDAE